MIKRLSLFAVLPLLLVACFPQINRSTTSNPPILAVPTVISPGGEAAPVEDGGVVATETPIPEPTLVTEAELVEELVVEPATQATGQFSGLTFSYASDGIAFGVLPGGIEELFAVWNYSNMSGDEVVRRVWTKNGEEWLVREEVWDQSKYGSNGTVRDISVYDFEGTGLESGSYMLTLFINDVEQLTGTFEITPDLSSSQLSASTETQIAWIFNGGSLMFEAADGSTSELLKADEIVELQWLPDGQHLLYVNRLPPPEGGPPWQRHELWLVDTSSGEYWQLSDEAENLRRLDTLANPYYVRTLPGSDFADACGMDRDLAFLKLDENYQRLDLLTLRDFDSQLEDQPYYFFPSDSGKWVSDHEYDINITAFCMSQEMGTSAEDLALIGLYRFNLETMTAEKIGN